MNTTHLKSAVEYAKKLPKWKKWTYGFIAFALINAVVNPAPKQTEAQRAIVRAAAWICEGTQWRT